MARGRKRDWSDGVAGAPWWAIVAIVVGAIVLAVLGPIVAGRKGDALPQAELNRMAAAASAAAASDEAARPRVVAFIGDSYTAGAGASDPAQRFTTLVAAHENWRENNFGRGGTGYISPVEGSTAQVACGLARCPSYGEMIPDAAKVSPEIVMVSGGRNEASVATKDGYAGGVADFYRQLRQALPNARIVATSPVWGSDMPPAGLAAIQRAVEAGVTAVGGTYLDVGEPLQGHPEWIVGDGVHPNSEGHHALADAIDGALDAAS